MKCILYINNDYIDKEQLTNHLYNTINSLHMKQIEFETQGFNSILINTGFDEDSIVLKTSDGKYLNYNDTIKWLEEI